MREEYDFSQGRKNPYVKQPKKQVTINLDAATVDYFKKQAAASGIPYQTLIDLYLADCVAQKKQLQTLWK